MLTGLIDKVLSQGIQLYMYVKYCPLSNVTSRVSLFIDSLNFTHNAWIKSTRKETKCCEEQFVHLINNEINRLQYVYLERREVTSALTSALVFMRDLLCRVGFWTVGFCREKLKSENPKKNPRSKVKTSNKVYSPQSVKTRFQHS